MKNKLKMTLAAITLALVVASCNFFKSEKPVADQKDTTPPDTVQVTPDTVTLEEHAPDSTVSK